MERLTKWDGIVADRFPVPGTAARRTPGFAARRRFWPLGPGLMRLDQHTRCAVSGTGLDVTGPCWIVATVSISRGALCYVRGGALVAAPGRRFALLIPPFSIVECRLDRAAVRSAAVAGRTPWRDDLPRVATAFHPAPDELPASPAAIALAFSRAGRHVAVGRDVDPSPLSSRLKSMIDDGFAELAPLTALAGRLRTSPAVLSRYFKRDYGLPPATYRHAIRVMDALVRLVDGEPVADVAGAVGFGALSQFYRHFGALACGPPGRYHQRSRIPKIG